MSITDELRKWGRATLADTSLLVRMEAIADRIDAEHQKALDEWKAEHGQMWLKGYSECHAELLEGNETLASDLERCGWIRLPKDADGEYIHVGDVMESKDGGPLFGEGSFEVRAMRCDECGWEVYDRLGDRYAPSLLRHHHAPTVEDVLRDFGIDWEHESDCEDRAALLKEYAKRLKLAEGRTHERIYLRASARRHAWRGGRVHREDWRLGMAIKKAEIPVDGNYHGRSTDDLNDFIKSGWDSAEVELDGRTTSNVRNALKMAIVRRGITDVKAITRRGKVYLVKVAE